MNRSLCTKTPDISPPEIDVSVSSLLLLDALLRSTLNDTFALRSYKPGRRRTANLRLYNSSARSMESNPFLQLTNRINREFLHCERNDLHSARPLLPSETITRLTSVAG